MARPQSSELRRSGTTPVFEPDNVSSRLEASEHPGTSGPTGPVPAENRPGHHPEHDQDKPDLDAFAQRFNRTDPAPGADSDGPAEGVTERLVARARPVVSSAARVSRTAVLTGVRLVERGAVRVAAGARWLLDNYPPDEERSDPAEGTTPDAEDR